jgi:hypothetical protein
MTTKIFRPIKLLSRKHNVAIIVVHHLGKADRQRMGQRMLGSMANHAWSEDSMYLLKSSQSTVKMEVESKVAPGQIFKLGNLDNNRWEPQISTWRKDDEQEMSHTMNGDRSRGRNGSGQGSDGASRRGSLAGEALSMLGGIQQTRTIADQAGITYQQAYRQLTRDPKVQKHGNGWSLK